MRSTDTRAQVRAAALVAMLLGWSALPARAHAAGPPGAAEFDAALRAYNQKQYDIACPAFLKSYELDPTKPGVPHALGECYAKAGKVASAVLWYREYLKVADALPTKLKEEHRDRMKRAEVQLAALAADVPAVTILVRGTGAPKARVLLDDKELQQASLKDPQPIDPGEHRVRVTSAEGVTVERAFTINRGEKKSIELDLQSKSAASSSSSLPPPPGMSGQRIGAFAAFGVGAAGLIVMGVTGSIVMAKKGDVDQGCHDVRDGVGICNSPDALSDAKSLRTLAIVSDVSLGVGLAAAALGTVLFFTEPKKTQSAGAPRWIAFGPARIDREAVLIGAAGAF